MARRRAPTNHPEGETKTKQRRPLEERIASQERKLAQLRDQHERAALKGTKRGRQMAVVQQALRIMADYNDDHEDGTYQTCKDFLQALCDTIKESPEEVK